MHQLGRDRGTYSLSRSSFEYFSSSNFVLNYSSDEDEYASDQQQQLDKLTNYKLEYDMNRDTFIELDLRSSVLAATGDDDDDDKELDYFRISFSALDDDDDHDHANAQLTVTPPCNNINDSPGPDVQSTPAWYINPRPTPCTNYPTTTVNIFPPPPADHYDYYADVCRPINNVIRMSWKLVRSRKASSSATKIRNSSAAAGNGGIMKLLVKMRCIISGLGSTGATSMIPRPCCRASSSCTAADQTYNSRICRINAFMKMMKPFDRWFMSWPRNLHQLIMTMRSPSTKVELVLDHDQMKLDATRRNYLFGSCGVMSPIKKTKTGSKSSMGRLNKSCPTSVKSSPVLHQSGDLSLLHAAIAHCKKS